MARRPDKGTRVRSCCDKQVQRSLNERQTCLPESAACFSLRVLYVYAQRKMLLKESQTLNILSTWLQTGRRIK